MADRLELASEEDRAAILADLPPDYDLRPTLNVLYDRSTEYSKHYQWDLAFRADLAGIATAKVWGSKAWIGTMYNLTGLSLYRLTKYDEALDNFKLALAAMREIGDKKGQADDWRGISNVESVRGNLTASQDAQEKALALWSAIDDQANVAEALIDLGGEYSRMGQNAKASDYLKRGLKLAQGMHNQLAADRALEALARLYTTQGDFQVALAYLEQVKRQPGSSLGEKRAEAYYDSILGDLYMKLNRPDANKVLEHGLQLALEGHDLRLAGWMSDTLATNSLNENDHRRFLQHKKEAAEIYADLGEVQQEMWALGTASFQHLLLDEPGQAIATAEKGLALARKTEWAENTTAALLDVARAYREVGRRDDALDAYRESIRVMETWREQLAGGQLNGANSFRNKSDRYLELMSMRVEDGDAWEALTLAESLRARRLLDVISQGKVDQDRSLSSEEKAQESALATVAAKYNNQPGANTQFEKAARYLEAYQTEIYTAHADLQARRGQSEMISREHLDSLAAQPGSLLIEYAFGDHPYVFTVARGEDGKARIDVKTLSIKPAQLAKRIEDYRKALATRDLSYKSEARDLYQALLSPIEAELKGKSIVGIVRDGVLWNLPFQALIAPDGKYFVEHAAIYYAPSLTVLYQTSHTGTTTSKLKPLLALGADAPDLAALYGPAATAFGGALATENRWKESAGGYRVLHVSSHGILNSQNPLFSYLQLAKSSPEDGMLEAREILDMKLHADLAVLSACETGRGEVIGGEGVFGMSWAMLTAGAAAVVVSQWKVDSESTTQMMSVLHRSIAPLALQPGPMRGKAEALRKAQMEMIRSPRYQHPFYWAAFEILGNGN